MSLVTPSNSNGRTIPLLCRWISLEIRAKIRIKPKQFRLRRKCSYHQKYLHKYGILQTAVINFLKVVFAPSTETKMILYELKKVNNIILPAKGNYKLWEAVKDKNRYCSCWPLSTSVNILNIWCKTLYSEQMRRKKKTKVHQKLKNTNKRGRVYYSIQASTFKCNNKKIL